ncbi:hypothetical protein ACQP00_37440 [Dactylosporangium sp. CS-047395]|uniref:hypothetical protein n=1 Tax=Dactylosporangium sp. CS-047395 TaxID=3239936 RepID=UPI003D8B1A99
MTTFFTESMSLHSGQSYPPDAAEVVYSASAAVNCAALVAYRFGRRTVGVITPTLLIIDLSVRMLDPDGQWDVARVAADCGADVIVVDDRQNALAGRSQIVGHHVRRIGPGGARPHLPRDPRIRPQARPAVARHAARDAVGGRR